MPFIHAAFLAAGLAVAIPWLIHLTRQRKYLRIRLGSLQFLEPIVRDRRRMSRVEQWPLLIARSLAVLLLALLFARPFFQKPTRLSAATGESIILLDASGSITADQAETIRSHTRDLIAALPKSSRPLLAAVSDQVKILPSLDAYQPIPGAPSGYTQAVDWIVDRVANSPAPIAKVHWFTDLQRAQLPNAPSRLWPAGLAAEIHPMPPPTSRNLAIEPPKLLTPFGNDHWEIEARVAVFGAPGSTPLALSLTTPDGQSIAATTPAEGGVAHFTYQGSAPDGLLCGEISLNTHDDAWPTDDRQPFAFATTQPKIIALVDGDPTDSPFTSETYFLEKALHASATGKALSPFRATISPSLPKENERPDVIAICNASGLSATNVRLLTSHLERGAGLVLFLGDQTAPTTWASFAQAGFLPSGLTLLAKPSSTLIHRFDLTHPTLAGLTPESAQALKLIPLTARFSWPASPQWPCLIAFENEVPLMGYSTEHKIAVVAHGMNREGTDLPLDPAFVPFIQGLFSNLAKTNNSTNKPSLTVESLTPGRDELRPPGRYPSPGSLEVIQPSLLEANITNTDEATFRQVLGLPASDAPAPTIAPLAAQADPTQLREGELWPWILAGLLALITVESILAARRMLPAPSPSPHV
jgi:Aerotolerance regulator N-terminal